MMNNNNNNKPINYSNYVRFDVGGDLYTASRDTLIKFPDSFLAKCIAPEHDRRKDSSEFILIRRVGEYFRTILNYMNDEKSLDLRGWHEENIKDLMEEADFYGLIGLVELCQAKLDTYFAELANPGYVEIVLNSNKMKILLDKSEKSVLVFAVDMILAYGMDTENWTNEMLHYCDFNKYDIYLFWKKAVGGKDIIGEDHMVALYPNGRVGKPKFLNGFLRYKNGHFRRHDKFSKHLYKSRLMAFLLLVGREAISAKILSNRLNKLNSDYWP